MQLLNIEARKTEQDQIFVFLLTFLASDGSKPFAVLNAGEIMNYPATVTFIAQRTGRVFLDPDSEGLPEDQANRFWRLRVASILNTALPAQPANPAVN